jgi:RHS repeat-associated protein
MRPNRYALLRGAGSWLRDRHWRDVRLHLDGAKKHVVIQCFDPLYRLGMTQDVETSEPATINCGQALGSSVGITTDRRYSFTSTGNYQLVSNPYRATTDDTMGLTLTTRDTLGRVKEVRSYLGAALPSLFPGGTNTTTSGAVITSYSVNTANAAAVTTVTDQNSVTHQNATDRLGRLNQVVEGGTYTTQYAYDLLDNLTTVTQGAVVRNFTYSSLGRLLTADNPETRDPQHPTRTIAYTYDNNGNLTARTDTRLSQMTTAPYDALNRITSKTYTPGTAQPTPAVVYCYDGNASVNGAACPTATPVIPFRGRLKSVSSSASTTTYLGYDFLGRITGSRQTTGGVNYDFSYGYNLLGTLTSIGYPNSNRVVTSAFDNAGRVTSVTGAVGTGTPTTYATVPSNSSFAPHGAIQTLNFNNGVVETTRFNARLQPLSIIAKLANATRLGLQYNYCSDFTDIDAQHTCASNNGNMWRQQIAFDAIGAVPAFAETQVYSHDAFNRLTQADTPTWSQPNGYDQWGNRWVNNPTGLPSMTAETPIAQSWFLPTNRINGWAYDEMGNVQGMTGMSRSFAYDVENRQVQATVNGTTSYTYDGDGRRVTKITPGTDPVTHQPTTFTTTYVYDAAGQLAQEYSTAPPTDSATSYLTADHLGSTRLITDASGGVKKRFDYLPFGEELVAGTGGRTKDMHYNDDVSVSVPDTQSMKFTGKKRDAKNGLNYLGARYFSGAQGRFTSPDFARTPAPIPYADLQDPQTLNLYAYVRNSPLTTRDSDGHQTKRRVIELGKGYTAAIDSNNANDSPNAHIYKNGKFLGKIKWPVANKTAAGEIDKVPFWVIEKLDAMMSAKGRLPLNVRPRSSIASEETTNNAFGLLKIVMVALEKYADSLEANRTGIGTNDLGQLYIADLGKAAATIGEGNTIRFGVDDPRPVLFVVKDGKFVSVDPNCPGCTLVQDKDGRVEIQRPVS